MVGVEGSFHVEGLRLLLTMLLNDGRHAGMTLLRKETVDSMFENHIGPLEITPVDAQIDLLSNNLDMGFGAPAKWGLGFLLHTQGTANGRSPGSASWAGLFNSYFWIDREKGLFGVFYNPGTALHGWEVSRRFDGL